MVITLTEQQLNNLKAFMLRVDLKGSEVGAFAEIIGILNSPPNEQKKDVK